LDAINLVLQQDHQHATPGKDGKQKQSSGRGIHLPKSNETGTMLVDVDSKEKRGGGSLIGSSFSKWSFPAQTIPTPDSPNEVMANARFRRCRQRQ
jgi:hypothetical protein